MDRDSIVEDSGVMGGGGGGWGEGVGSDIMEDSRILGRHCIRLINRGLALVIGSNSTNRVQLCQQGPAPDDRPS